MELGDYFLEFDRTGFPLVRRKTWNFFISLMPVTIAQVEFFVSNCGETGKTTCNVAWWYRHRNRKLTTAHDLIKSPWEYFIRGVPPEQLTGFFTYQGPQYRLPSSCEWSIFINDALNLREMHPNFMRAIKDHPGCARSVDPLLSIGLIPFTELNPKASSRVPQGMYEYVTTEKGVRCMGQPWQELRDNTDIPLAVKPLPVTWESQISRAFGFRMARQI